jgi:hypothetical protein
MPSPSPAGDMEPVDPFAPPPQPDGSQAVDPFSQPDPKGPLEAVKVESVKRDGESDMGPVFSEDPTTPEQDSAVPIEVVSLDKNFTPFSRGADFRPVIYDAKQEVTPEEMARLDALRDAQELGVAADPEDEDPKA